MTKDYNAELERIQQLALDHAIEEMDASDERGVDSAQERGDRGFLTGMASKSLAVAVRIEQFLALRRGDGGAEGGPGDDDAEEAKAKAALVSKAKTEVAKIMERAGVGYHQRGR